MELITDEERLKQGNSALARDPQGHEVQTQAVSVRGRPKDPSLEDRVFDAAIDLYGRGGWSALTIESVSRKARVGKAAIYARWSDREGVLRETLDARWLSLAGIDSGSFKQDLTLLARALFSSFAGDHGNVLLFLQADSLCYPEVRRVRAPYARRLIREGRQIVKRAVDRHEIPTDANTALIMDMITGAIANHVSTTPLRLRDEMGRKSAAYIETLVDAAIRIAR